MCTYIGRAKQSIARVRLEAGDGIILINNIALNTYMQNNAYSIECVQKPLDLVGVLNKYNTTINVWGGGFMGQAKASSLGIARALEALHPSYRSILKTKHYLTQDSRQKERKKYGLKKARKAAQFSKR